MFRPRSSFKIRLTAIFFDRHYELLNDLIINRRSWEACKYSGSFILLTSCYALASVWYSDDPETYNGAPVGLQIVAHNHEDEKVWAIIKTVDVALKAKTETD